MSRFDYGEPQCIYSSTDEVLQRMSPSQLADYIWMNYPQYAEDLAEEIKSKLYLQAMDTSPNLFNYGKEE